MKTFELQLALLGLLIALVNDCAAPGIAIPAVVNSHKAPIQTLANRIRLQPVLNSMTERAMSK